MMSISKIIHYSEDPQNFLQCLTQASLDELPTPQQFTLLHHYRRAEFSPEFEELSFCILEKQIVSAFVFATKIKGAVSSHYNGVRIIQRTPDKSKIKSILKYLLDLAKNKHAHILKIDDSNLYSDLSITGKEAFNLKGIPHTHLRAIQSLTLSEKELYASIRSRYRTYINKSRDRLTLAYMTADNADRSTFDQFKAFHKKITGRQTRPLESWEVQFKMIQQGDAELIMGYLDDYGLVSSALFIDYGPLTYYGVGVFERKLFDQPLGHLVIYEGMQRARQRCQKQFYIGTIPAFNESNVQEYNIGKFKSGFCKTLTPSIEWTINIA